MLHHHIKRIPTPMAGLALGVASLGWCMENALPLEGWGRTVGAIIATCLLISIAIKFITCPKTLWEELTHPIVGSVVPTFSMALMIIAYTLSKVWFTGGELLWISAVTLQAVFVCTFVYHRLRDFQFSHLIPSWFVPAVGICVADVSFPGGRFAPLAEILLWVGLTSCAIMLPLMLYRLIFHAEIPDPAKPTIAILAAPVSLSLAAYLSIETSPSLLLCAILTGIALLMTAVIYLSFIRLLRLPFTPAYAAYTFPMVISPTALYKSAELLTTYPNTATYIAQLRTIASIELGIAFLVVIYVALRYFHYYSRRLRTLHSSSVTQV